jgi:hypothetical protein
MNIKWKKRRLKEIKEMWTWLVVQDNLEANDFNAIHWYWHLLKWKYIGYELD